MKRYLLLTATMLILSAPPSAWSQTSMAPPPPTSVGGEPGPANGTPAQNQQMFQQRKAEILQRMNEHIAEMQKRVSCVEGASNHQALMECMPRREGMGGPGGGMGNGGFGGGQHPMPGGAPGGGAPAPGGE